MDMEDMENMEDTEDTENMEDTKDTENTEGMEDINLHQEVDLHLDMEDMALHLVIVQDQDTHPHQDMVMNHTNPHLDMDHHQDTAIHQNMVLVKKAIL